MIELLAIGLVLTQLIIIWLVVWIGCLHHKINEMQYGKNAWGQVVRNRHLND